MQADKNIYDGWVNDSDLIGTHFRYGKTESITDMMANEGKAYTSPTLDLKDFIGTSFTTAPDGKLYQLPDQQFANLYWFRAHCFERDRKSVLYGKCESGRVDLGGRRNLKQKKKTYTP